MTMPIYLDYGATTPLDPAVAAVMEPWGVDGFGNPHSAHMWGYKAKAAVERAREQVARLINAPVESIALLPSPSSLLSSYQRTMNTPSR